MTEPTYTLDDARAEIARRECALSGHTYDVTATRTFGGPGRPIGVFCTVCQEHWEIKPKDKS